MVLLVLSVDVNSQSVSNIVFVSGVFRRLCAMFAPAHLFKVMVVAVTVAFGAKGWTLGSPDSCWGVPSVPSGPTVRAGILIFWW